MAEEFQESEVIFSDQDHHDKNNCNNYYFGRQEMDVEAQLDHPNSRVSCNNKMKAKKTKQNKLVNIPDNNGVDEEYDGGELVPPHLIVGRRREGKMAFSVCTGNGRTLKGRDLSEVRDSILRMTGFLET